MLTQEIQVLSCPGLVTKIHAFQYLLRQVNQKSFSMFSFMHGKMVHGF